jgi:hypothetical protein
LNSFDKIVIRARTAETQPRNAKITLTNKDGFSFSAPLTITNVFRDIEIPINDMHSDSALLLPRPYPGFLPLRFKGLGTPAFKLADMEKVQLTVGEDVIESEFKKPYSLEVQSIWLESSTHG